MSIAQAQTMMLGLALGDALGYVTEFKSLPEIKAIYGPQGIQQPPDPALYSDDTQMTIALAEGLLDAGINAPLDELMTAVACRFVEWAETAPNRAPGHTCLTGAHHLARGDHWREAGVPQSKGCGAAMRVAPLGYLYQHQPERLREIAKASSILTHGHPTAVASALAAAYLVKLALDGVPHSEYMQRIMTVCEGLSDELDAAILRVGHVLGWGSEESAMRYIGEGWIAEEAVALALYCVLRYPDDYAACVRRAANSDGDNDSVACIAGGIVAARAGALDALPATWIRRTENRAVLLDLGMRLAYARGG